MATIFDPSELEAMKRPQLQKLCKSLGIKANSKTSQLVADLQKYAKTYFPVSSKTPIDTMKGKNPRKLSNTRKSSEVLAKKRVTETNKNNVKRVSTEEETAKMSEYKEQILHQLEKKVEESMPGNIFDCKIPRFVTSGVKVSGVKPSTAITPSNKWTNIHQKNFDKMDSIDVYLAKKRKGTEAMYESVKKAKNTVLDAKSTIESIAISPGQPLKLYSKSATFIKETKNTPNAAKQPLKSKLKTPTKTTSKLPAPKIHVRIVESRRKSENWGRVCSKLKTPTVRKSVAFIPHKNGDNIQKTPNAATRKSVAGTPFRQINQKPIPATPKIKFDLQASLAKPLNYKPHTGKLKRPPFLNKTENKRPVRAVHPTEHKDIKSVKVITRETRRSANIKARTARRANAVNARRGLN